MAIGADSKHLGAKLGVTAVLHTWGSARQGMERMVSDVEGLRYQRTHPDTGKFMYNEVS